MKPSIFGYKAPATIDEAIGILTSDADAVVLAGGQTLLPAMNFRAANPSILVDIQHVEGLRGIAVGISSALPVSIEHIAKWAKAAQSRGLLLVPITAVAVKAKQS